MNLKQQMFKKLFFLIIVLFVPLFFAVNFFIGILIDIFYTRYYEMKAESFNEYKIKKLEIGRIVLRNFLFIISAFYQSNHNSYPENPIFSILLLFHPTKS